MKAFDEETNGGLSRLWESVVGYTKKDILIEGGFLYVFCRNKDHLSCHGSYELSKLLKVFVDTEKGSIRLVFNIQAARVTKNYELQDLVGFMKRLVI